MRKYYTPKKRKKKILMTTVVGVKCIDGFVIASDSQLSVGSSFKEIGYDKIKNVGNILIAYSGHDEYFKRVLDDIKEKLTNTKIDDFKKLKEVFESCILDIRYRFPVEECYTEMIFGTAIDNKTGFYWINSADCFAVKIDNYYPIGSGGNIAKYIFSKLWNIKLSCLEARVILAYVIHETTTIDKGSSPPVKIATITNSGNIWFSESDFMDDVINAFSKAEKRFNFFLFKFMTDPGSIEFLENGLRIKNDKQKKV